jgi:4-hydroxybenzoate polyprenyltransferase
MTGDAGPKAWEERFIEKVDRFIAWLEKDHFPLFAVFLMVLGVALARDLLEYYLLDPEFVSTAHPWIYSIAHHLSFYVVVFMGLVFLLSAFSGRGVRRSINYVSTFYWIIILPPILDYLAGTRQNYAYFSWTDFLNALFHFSGSGFHIGQAIEVVIILFALFAYTIWTQRASLFTIKDRAITVVRIAFLVIFTFVFMFFMGTPAAFLPVDSYAFPNFESTKYYQHHLFFFAYYLSAGVVLALALTYLATKGNFRNVVRSMRPPQTLFFGAIVVAGVAIGWQLSSSVDLVTQIVQTPYWVNLAFLGIAALASLLAWQASTIWNDVSDRESDEPRRGDRLIAVGYLDNAILVQISLVLVSVSLLSSLLLSWSQGIIIGLIFVLSFIYSFKPVRFKAHILSPMLIGLGTFFAFLFGYLTPYSVVAMVDGAQGLIPYLTGAVEQPALTPEGFYLGFFGFAGLVIGSMVTDIEGYHEDARAGVRTIYTVLGLERGKKVVSLLIFLGALMPLFLFHSPMDVLVFPVLGSAAALLFWREGRSRWVIVLALGGLLYAAISYIDMLSLI